MDSQPVGAMTPIRGTWWPSVDGTEREEFALPWATFVRHLREIQPHHKETSPLIKLATFGDQRTRRGSLRHDRNVLDIWGLEGDYDAGQVSPEEAIERLERYQLRAVVVTTHRHTPERPRWRVYAPLSARLDPKERRDYVAALNGALGGILADESFRLSQSYYIGRPLKGEYRVLSTYGDDGEGYTLDQLDSTERAELAMYPATVSPVVEHDTEQPVVEASPGAGVPDLIDDMLEHIVADDYYDWVRVGAALHYCDPDAGLEVWDQWSATSDKYPGRQEIEKRWRSFSQSRGGKTANAGTIVNMARRAGYEGPSSSPDEIRARTARLGVDLSAFDIHSLPQPDSDVPMFASLALLLSRPELLEPPREVVPRIAWQGRTTGLIGPDKSGKSTLLGHAVAALTNGEAFLDRPVERGSALIVAPDEAVGDTVRRLQDVGANPALTRLLTLHPERLLDHLRAEMAREAPTLLVVDSLAEWARLIAGRAPDDGDAAGWGAVVRPLVQLSRDFNCATVMLHHPRRSDGQYRGSGEIAAALDCLLEIRVPGNDEEQTRRNFSGRARWPIEEFSIELVGSRYQLVGEVLPLETRILVDAQVAGPTTRTAQAKRLRVRKADYLEAVRKMIEEQQLFEKDGQIVAGSHVGD